MPPSDARVAVRRRRRRPPPRPHGTTSRRPLLLAATVTRHVQRRRMRRSRGIPSSGTISSTPSAPLVLSCVLSSTVHLLTHPHAHTGQAEHRPHQDCARASPTRPAFSTPGASRWSILPYEQAPRRCRPAFRLARRFNGAVGLVNFQPLYRGLQPAAAERDRDQSLH